MSHTVGQQWCTLHSCCARDFLCSAVPTTKPRLLLFPNFSPAVPHTCTLEMQPLRRGSLFLPHRWQAWPRSSPQFTQERDCAPGPFPDHAGFTVDEGMIWAMKDLSHVILILHKPEFYILLWIWMRELNFVPFYFAKITETSQIWKVGKAKQLLVNFLDSSSYYVWCQTCKGKANLCTLCMYNA